LKGLVSDPYGLRFSKIKTQDMPPRLMISIVKKIPRGRRGFEFLPMMRASIPPPLFLQTLDNEFSPNEDSCLPFIPGGDSLLTDQCLHALNRGNAFAGDFRGIADRLAAFAAESHPFRQFVLLFWTHPEQIVRRRMPVALERFQTAQDFGKEQLVFQIYPVIEIGAEAVFLPLAILRHHDDGSLQASHHPKDKVEQNVGVFIEGTKKEKGIDRNPEERKANRRSDEFPAPAKFRDQIRCAIGDGEARFFLLVGVARNAMA
jgi:hypothetical protein